MSGLHSKAGEKRKSFDSDSTHDQKQFRRLSLSSISSDSSDARSEARVNEMMEDLAEASVRFSFSEPPNIFTLHMASDKWTCIQMKGPEGTFYASLQKPSTVLEVAQFLANKIDCLSQDIHFWTKDRKLPIEYYGESRLEPLLEPGQKFVQLRYEKLVTLTRMGKGDSRSSERSPDDSLLVTVSGSKGEFHFTMRLRDSLNKACALLAASLEMERGGVIVRSESGYFQSSLHLIAHRQSEGQSHQHHLAFGGFCLRDILEEEVKVHLKGQPLLPQIALKYLLKGKKEEVSSSDDHSASVSSKATSVEGNSVESRHEKFVKMWYPNDAKTPRGGKMTIRPVTTRAFHVFHLAVESYEILWCVMNLHLIHQVYPYAWKMFRPVDS